MEIKEIMRAITIMNKNQIKKKIKNRPNENEEEKQERNYEN